MGERRDRGSPYVARADAQTTLILTHQGGRYELSVKRRTNDAGELVEYLAADSLQSYVTGLYRAAGLVSGFSSHSGRRTFASRLLAQGQSLDTVQLQLGHAELDHVAPYLEVSRHDRREGSCTAGRRFGLKAIGDGADTSEVQSCRQLSMSSCAGASSSLFSSSTVRSHRPICE